MCFRSLTEKRNRKNKVTNKPLFTVCPYRVSCFPVGLRVESWFALLSLRGEWGALVCSFGPFEEGGVCRFLWVLLFGEGLGISSLAVGSSGFAVEQDLEVLYFPPRGSRGGRTECVWGVKIGLKIRRASGECLGAVCRRRTCQATIRGRELQASFDLPISEWVNPAGVMTSHPRGRARGELKHLSTLRKRKQT